MSNLSILELTSVINLLKERIVQSHNNALLAVNKELISLYWDIGKIIVDRQVEEKWGRGVVSQISKELQSEFPGISGFSTSNLWRCRSFYITYKQNQILAQLVRELSWSHNIAIFEKCKTDEEKIFYINKTIQNAWSRNKLIESINSNLFKNFTVAQSNFSQVLSSDISTHFENILQDEVDLSILGIKDTDKELNVESKIVNNIVKFLSQMGGGFSFVGRQYPININENEYFIDLLFYHRELKSLIAVELKADKFKPEYAGKMAMYLAALDEIEKKEYENPSVGIIICKQKDRNIVDLSLRFISKPIGVATYKTYSESEVPQNIIKALPHINKLASQLADIA